MGIRFVALIFVLLILASPRLACADGVSSGLSIVEDFHAGMQALLKDAPQDDKEVSAIAAGAGQGREKAAADLNVIQRTEAPGRRRSQRIYGIVDNYTGMVLKSFVDLSARRSASGAARLDAIIDKLASLKETRMKALEEILRGESGEKRGEKPVPAIDRPRGETTPEGGASIWDR